MQKLPILSGAELIKLLSNFDFVPVRQKGSHVALEKETPFGTIHCTVPLHRELKKGTLLGILRESQISKEEFMKYI